jgi:hypothetical protein
MKLTEDWLSVVLGFVVILIAIMDFIDPAIFKF